MSAHRGSLCVPRANYGFTLIEVAIVLVIVGLLLGGLLMPLATQVDLQRVEETKKSMEEINEAIIGFALANRRLPCPADPTIANGAAGAGVARLTCTTAATVVGVVPWATLGVSETDAWGRRFTYRVTQLFADNVPSTVAPCPTPATTSFSLCNVGDNVVSDGSTNIVNDAPALVVSHGRNGWGAYTSLGTQMAAATSADEIENYAGTATIFVSRTMSPAQTPCGGVGQPACEFDDIVSWLVPGILFNRMVAAGLLPDS